MYEISFPAWSFLKKRIKGFSDVASSITIRTLSSGYLTDQSLNLDVNGRQQHPRAERLDAIWDVLELGLEHIQIQQASLVPAKAVAFPDRGKNF